MSVSRWPPPEDTVRPTRIARPGGNGSQNGRLEYNHVSTCADRT
jgi:hypothetical protein